MTAALGAMVKCRRVRPWRAKGAIAGIERAGGTVVSSQVSGDWVEIRYLRPRWRRAKSGR